MAKTPKEAPNISKTYEPREVEKKIYDYWLDNDCFSPKKSTTGKRFSIVIPPPNVTGNLHIGHAVFIAVQDAMVRYHRMKGDETVWIPGTDHSGIATQVVVEKKLAAEGKTRHDFSREDFLKVVWDWVKIYKKNIIDQLKTMGASCDWDRERFTFDDHFNEAVNKVFVDFYKKDLIYRGDYIVNWCSRCASVLSDLEAIPKDETSKLYYIRYFVKAADKSVIVATTRPETMLGDVAVAVHPDDKRFKEFHDKTLILPILNKEIPIVLDERVEMSFGTGAVKITPSHDQLDYEIGLDHKLPHVTVIGKDGRMNKNAGKFAGLDVKQARQNLIEYLDNIGNLEKIEKIQSSVKHCERCDTVIEPMISKQWFVRGKPLAEKCIKAVKSSKTTIIPERFEKEFMHWMENMRDWCISRQLWWGHQIPVYYSPDGRMKVQEQAPKSGEWTRDEDVLDTWFSAALWPFVVFGWPENTADLKKFYPTTVLETGRDILFFWVSKMMMMGLQVMGKVPFQYVYLHGLVRDENNQKMSKSKGNCYEPAVLQEKYGTDATRLALILGNTPGNDSNISDTKAEGYRHFVNKLWNASRFIRMNMDKTSEYQKIQNKLSREYKKLHISQKWILSRIETVVRDFTESFENYSFGDAGTRLYEFTWSEFCDWYIEISKIEKNAYTELVLQYGILTILKLWHPFAPFVTEEIWKYFDQEGALATSTWPETVNKFIDEGIQEDFNTLMEVVRSIRNIRQERGVAPGKEIEAYFVVEDKKKHALIKSFEKVIEKLARIGKSHVVKKRPTLDKKVTHVVYPYEIYLPLEGMIDLKKEKERLTRKVADLEKAIRILGEKLANEKFVENAPKEVVQLQREKKVEQEETLATLRLQLEEISA